MSVESTLPLSPSNRRRASLFSIFRSDKSKNRSKRSSDTETIKSPPSPEITPRSRAKTSTESISGRNSPTLPSIEQAKTEDGSASPPSPRSLLRIASLISEMKEKKEEKKEENVKPKLTRHGSHILTNVNAGIKPRKSPTMSTLRREGVVTEEKNKLSGSAPSAKLRFGVHLDELIGDGGRLPVMFLMMISQLEARALDTPGIFFFDTENDPKFAVQELKTCIEKGKLEIHAIANVHSLAGLLKTFLAELPVPILAYHLYRDWLIVADEVKDVETQIRLIRSLVYQLPPSHRLVLQYLLSLFRKFQEHSSTNHMNSHMLAKAFAPIMMRPEKPNLDTPKEMTISCPSIIRLMLTHYEKIFMVVEDTDFKFMVKNDFPVVRLGTVDNILLAIMDPFSIDREIIPTFIACQDYFITRDELLTKLKNLHEKIKEENGPNYRVMLTDRMQNVLRTWANSLRSDPCMNTPFGSDFRSFLTGNFPEILPLFDRPRPTSPELIKSPAPNLLIEIDITQWNVMELCRQIALINQRMFCGIDTRECLHKSFMNTDCSPTFAAITSRVNMWALWVATEIMKRETATERAEVITFFIKASEGCRELSDFLGCCAIFAGLCTSSVDRLRQTWSGVSKGHMKQYNKLAELFDMGRNYKNYRDEIEKCSLPAVPYIVLYTKYLFSTEENNPDLIEGMINFTKYRLLYHHMREIQRYQSQQYDFGEIQPIYNYLIHIKAFDRETLSELSSKYEPKRDSLSGSKGPIPQSPNPISLSNRSSGDNMHASTDKMTESTSSLGPEDLLFSLDKLMQSVRHKDIFHSWLSKESAGDLLDFYEDALSFSHLEDQNDIQTGAQRIYNDYFQENGISLPDRIVQQVEEAVKFRVFDHRTYQSAQEYVWKELEENYFERFSASDDMLSLMQSRS